MSNTPIRVDAESWNRVVELTDGAASVCFQCGTCTATCPWGIFDDDPLSVRDIMRRAQVGVDGDSDGSGNAVYQCLTCRACEAACPRGVDVVEAIAGLREGVYEEDRPPGRLENALWSVYEEDNPWERPASDRDAWLEQVPETVDVQVGGEAEILFYVGCSPSYDPALQDVPAAIAGLLDAADVDFAVLGDQEDCCGDVVKQTGESEFFAEIADANAERFGETGASTVITTSPHCMEVFDEEYDLDAEVLHYTEFLLELVETGSLELGERDEAVTYHDPCYLSRGAGIVSEPRTLLETIGVDYREMEAYGYDTLCCGGGGGNMWLESDLDERFADHRAVQATETGADEVVTACPYCIQNLEDGLKKIGSDLPVRDLSTVLLEAALPEGGDRS